MLMQNMTGWLVWHTWGRRWWRCVCVATGVGGLLFVRVADEQAQAASAGSPLQPVHPAACVPFCPLGCWRGTPHRPVQYSGGVPYDALDALGAFHQALPADSFYSFLRRLPQERGVKLQVGCPSGCASERLAGCASRPGRCSA